MWHHRLPKDPLTNLRWRKYVLRRCRNEPSYRKAIFHACTHDLCFYVNTFVYQFNPKIVGNEVGPFITWGFQEETSATILKQLIEYQDDVLVEKSRELGWTWWALIILDWLALFHPWKKFLAVSHSADAVDRPGDADSLFWKLDFIHSFLPDWLLRGVTRRKMNFTYPATNSSFTGAASTERSGVGGRATAVLLDEFSKQRDDYKIWGQTADTGPRIIIGTHYGLDSCFYGLSQRADMKKIISHWSHHPEKAKGAYFWDKDKQKIEVQDKTYSFPPDFDFIMDGSPTGGPFPGLRSPWYDRECIRRKNARDVAMHLDINPKGSISQFFDPLQIRELIRLHACEPYWEGEISYDQDTGRPLGLVKTPGGKLRLWCHLPDGHPPVDDYAMGADISTGSGATPSCISIISASTGDKVGEYYDRHIEPIKLAPRAVAIAWTFKNAAGDGAKFAWETPGPGASFGKHVMDTGYRNIYYRTNDLKLTIEASETPGWYASNPEKLRLLEEYRAALLSRQFLNRSEMALEETLAFRYTPKGTVEHSAAPSTGDPTGAGANHGDLVIADALAWKMCQVIGRPQRKKKETPRAPVLSLQWRRDLVERREREEQEA